MILPDLKLNKRFCEVCSHTSIMFSHSSIALGVYIYYQGEVATSFGVGPNFDSCLSSFITFVSYSQLSAVCLLMTI